VPDFDPFRQAAVDWCELPDDLSDLFTLLSWRAHLTDIVGQDEELEKLVAWARDSNPSTRIRFLTGPGGSGKSRLAAELAQKLHGENPDEWDARFVEPESEPVNITRARTLLIVDYPEERRSFAERILELVSRSPHPALRLLFLSRQPLESWRRDVTGSQAARFIGRQEITIPRLSQDDAVFLYRRIIERLTKRYRREPLRVHDRDIRAWLGRNSLLHTLPLFIIAAAIHAVIDPGQALGFSGEQIVQALVDRELNRMRGASLDAKFASKEAVSRLAALAAVRGGLDVNDLARLSSPSLRLGLSEGGTRIVENVRRLMWWQGERWPAPTPDIIAAALLFKVLKADSDMASEWLWAAIDGTGREIIDRLGRLSYDIGTIYRHERGRFTEWLVTMVANDPMRSEKLEFFTIDERLPVGMAPVAAAIGNVLVDSAISDRARARQLNNLSNRLSDAGDKTAALKRIREAVAIRRDFGKRPSLRYEAELAATLNNLSNRLSDTSDRSGALASVQEAAEILERCADLEPDSYEAYFAATLNNLSRRLSDAGAESEALFAIQRAVEIRRRLARKQPAKFEPDLAGSLNNLSIHLSAKGNMSGAVETIRDAVGIYRQLAEEQPARFDALLAGSLSNLSSFLGAIGEHEAALDAIRQSVAIRRRLAEEEPARFEPELANSLNNLSNELTISRDDREALTAILEAADIYRRLADSYPLRFGRAFARVLNNLANQLSEAGDSARALITIREAVTICENAVSQGVLIEADLAVTLVTLANQLSPMGLADEAADDIGRAVDILRRLAINEPERYDPDLASGLNNAARQFAERGMTEAALSAIREAVEIRRRLVSVDAVRFEPVLARSLSNLAIALATWTSVADAEKAIGEAIAIYEQLLEKHPRQFREFHYQLDRCNKIRNQIIGTPKITLAELMEYLEDIQFGETTKDRPPDKTDK
jgi:hypothetical protein